MLTLNGQTYNFSQIQKLCSKYKTKDDWEGDIFSFISEWIDKKTDTIAVNTSGSTGKPKSITLKKEHLIQSALRTQHYLGIRQTDNALLCLPAKYIAGKMMIVRAFVTGYNLITVAPATNPFENITEPIDFTAITPHQLAVSFETLKNLTIRNIIVGGAEIPPTLEARLTQIPSPIYATYGMTETGSHVAMRRVNGSHPSVIYEALPDVEFDTDENNRLIIHASFLTYTPLITNDVVEIIDNKHFRWLGRFDNVINSGGIKVFPEEIERKIAPYIPYPFFIGSLPDDILSEKVCLFLNCKPFSTAEKQSIIQQIEPLLGRHQLPRQIVCLPQFEYTLNGKLDRRKTMKNVAI